VALLHRRRAKDLFDLVHGIMIDREPRINRLDVITAFLKRSIYEPVPGRGKQDLLAIPIEETRGFWNGLVVPAAAVLGFDQAVASLHRLIDELFALVPASAPATPTPAAPPFSSGGAWRPVQRVRRARVSPVAPAVGYGFGGISPSYRNTIINAGRAQTLVELGYDGYRRLVEPYKFEYHVRQSDGRGVEYFWGYDRSGGRSGKKSIKRFFADEIEYANSTNIRFTPQWTIEL
jgi:hypothetical protein